MLYFAILWDKYYNYICFILRIYVFDALSLLQNASPNGTLLPERPPKPKFSKSLVNEINPPIVSARDETANQDFIPLSPRKLRPTRPAPQPPTSVASPVLETRQTPTYGTLPGSTDLDGVPFALNPRLTHLNCAIVSVFYQFTKSINAFFFSRRNNIAFFSRIFPISRCGHRKIWIKRYSISFLLRSHLQIYSCENKRATWFFPFPLLQFHYDFRAERET